MIKYLTAKLLMSLYNLPDSQRFKTIKNFCIYTLIFLFISDVHRFGAWYTHNSSYWKSWAYIVIPTISIPIVLYVMALAVRWIVRTNRYRMIMAFTSALTTWIVSFIAFSDVYLNKKFPDAGYFINGIIRSDAQFWITFINTFVIFFVMPFFVFYFCVYKTDDGM